MPTTKQRLIIGSSSANDAVVIITQSNRYIPFISGLGFGAENTEQTVEIRNDPIHCKVTQSNNVSFLAVAGMVAAGVAAPFVWIYRSQFAQYADVFRKGFNVLSQFGGRRGAGVEGGLEGQVEPPNADAV